MQRCLWLLLSSSMLLGACATQPSPFVGFFVFYKDCREKYATIDAKIDAAGVRDAAYYRVPGYPYLRSERLLASFRYEVDDVNRTGGWIRRMREADQEAREFEYINLGLSQQEAASWRYDLLQCGRGLAGMELDDPAALQKMRDTMPPPDDYSTSARFLGLHALTGGAIRADIAAQDRTLHQRFSGPLPTPSASLTLWKAKIDKDPSTAPPSFDATLPDELGFPGLSDSGWTYLAQKFAPALWMETTAASDAPAAPGWKDGHIVADPAKPYVNFQVSFARFGERILAQITYFFWFQQQQGLDGLIWRVTLDRDIRPLVFESLRESGAEHLWFPAQPLQRLPANAPAARDLPHFPQDGVVPAVVALRLASATQRLDRVVEVPSVDAAAERSYELRRYEDLFTLPLPQGGSRSLFGPDGMAHDSVSTDLLWRWSTGIRNPGVARQYGRHAIDYDGRSHFDDPRLLETVFVPPAPAPAPAPPASAAAPVNP